MTVVTLPAHPNDCTYETLRQRAAAFVDGAPLLTSTEELDRAWEGVSRGFFNLRADPVDRHKAELLLLVLSRQLVTHEARLAQIHFRPTE